MTNMFEYVTTTTNNTSDPAWTYSYAQLLQEQDRRLIQYQQALQNHQLNEAILQRAKEMLNDPKVRRELLKKDLRRMLSTDEV